MSDRPEKRTVHRRKKKKKQNTGELRVLSADRKLPENRGRKVTRHSNVRNVLKNPFSDYERMEAVDGMVVITHSDGKQTRMPPLTFKQNIGDTLGLPAEGMEPAMRKRHFRKVELALEVVAKAMHQQETAGERDHRTKAVTEGLKNWHWQGGMHVKGRPAEYTEDHLPEEMQVRHYCKIYPNLHDHEVAGYIRMSREGRIKWKMAELLMHRMNLKREADENSDRNEQINQMVGEYKRKRGMQPGTDDTPEIIMP